MTAETFGRIPPHSLDAEAAMLAAALCDHRKLDRLASIVRPEHCYSDANRRVYEAALELQRSGTPADMSTVAAWLKDRDWLQAVGGISYLSRLVDATPAVAHVEAYARIVRDKARVRRLIDVCQLVAARGFGDYGDAEQYLAEAEAEVYAAARADAEMTARHLGDVIDEELDRIRAVQEGDASVLGVPTGIPSLDGIFNGFVPGEVTVLAGRPGQGKTALAVTLAAAVAASNHDGVTQCAFFASLEMKSAAIARRTLSVASGVNVRRYERGALRAGESDAFIVGAEHARRLPIWIDDKVRMTPNQLRGHIRRQQARFDKPKGHDGRPQRLSLVVVDYLQRMGSDTRRRERRDEVAENVNAIADAAKETGVHVMLLSQINRENTKRGKGESLRPRMSDLAESGEIEKTAHNIMLLHRPEYYEQDKRAVPESIKGLAEVINDKQRDGQTGIARLAYDGDATLFREPTQSESERWASHSDAPRKAYAPGRQRARWEGGAS